MSDEEILKFEILWGECRGSAATGFIANTTTNANSCNIHVV